MLARFFERIFKKKANVAILGLDQSGKTALFYQLLTNSFIRPPPTFGFNKGIVEMCGMDLDLIDVGGNEKLISLWRHYMNDVEGVIYVIDVCDERRYERNYNMVQELCQYPETTKLPLLILLNKTDLITIEECSSHKINDFKEKLKILKSKSETRMVSARSGEGVEDAICWICSQLGSRSARKTLKEKYKTEEIREPPQTTALCNDLEENKDKILHDTESEEFDPIDESGINFAESLEIIEKFFELQFRQPQKFSANDQQHTSTKERARTASGRMQQLMQRLSGFNPKSERSKRTKRGEPKYIKHQNETEEESPSQVTGHGEGIDLTAVCAASFPSHHEQQVALSVEADSSSSTVVNHKTLRKETSDSQTAKGIPTRKNIMSRLFASIRSKFSRA